MALVPQTVTRDAWPASVRAYDLGAHTFHRDIGLLHHANLSLSEQVTQLIALIVQAARQPATCGAGCHAARSANPTEPSPL